MTALHSSTIQRARSLTAAAIAAVLLTASAAAAQNGTSVGTLSLSSTFNAIGVRAGFSGDSNTNNSATLQFRPTGSSTWLDAYRPVVDRRSTVGGQSNAFINQFRGSIVGLNAGTSYDIRLTIADPDGVSGGPALTGTISTVDTAPPTGGTDWYVANGGTNGNGSSASPFNSIPTAIAAASPGYTIHIRPGSYPAFSMSKSGTASAWIALVGDNRDTTFITGGSVTNNVTMSADYVQLKNLRFKQTNHNSVEVGSGHHDVWLENLYHENVSSMHSYNDAGVLLDGGNYRVYILENTILSPTGASIPPLSTRWDSETCGIYFDGAANAIGGFIIRGNTIGSGADSGFRDCIGNTPETVGGGINDSDIYNNTVTGCRDDGIQMEGGDVNLRIWGNNVQANNGYSCFAAQTGYTGPIYWFRNVCRLSWTGGSGAAWKMGGLEMALIFHNSIETTGNGHDGLGDESGGSGGTMYITALNNIIKTQANPLYKVFSTGTLFDYNQYYRPGGGVIVRLWNGSTDYSTIAAFRSGTGSCPASGDECHGLSGDPRYVDTSLHIDPASPANNAGVVIPNFNDANSAWPYTGSAPDLGAYESAGSSVPSAPMNLRIIR